MKKRVLALVVILAGLAGCAKEPPDITEAEAFAIAEKQMGTQCGLGEGGAKCADFLYMGVFPPEDKRFKWGFHFLAKDTKPMNLIIAEVGMKGDFSTGLALLDASANLSKYTVKGSAVAMTAIAPGATPAKPGDAPPAKPGQPGAPAAPAAPGAVAAKPAEAGKPGEAAKPGAPAAPAAVAGKPSAPAAPKPAATPAKPVIPVVKVSTTTPETIEEMYPAFTLRNPFVKIEGGGAGAGPKPAEDGTTAGDIPEGEFSIAALEVKGILEDRAGGFAILVDPKYGASYVLKKGFLFDVKNKRVPGVTGTVRARQRTVELVDEEEERHTLTMKEKDEDEEAPGGPTASAPGFGGAPTPSAQ